MNPFVIKVGGEAVADPAVRAVVAADLATLQESASVVVVHGGGPDGTLEVSTSRLQATRSRTS